MSLVKKDIVSNISDKALFNVQLSYDFFNYFFLLIKDKARKGHVVKLPLFGNFYFKATPERIGRNPKTNEQFIISKRSKLNFKTSDKVKNILN